MNYYKFVMDNYRAAKQALPLLLAVLVAVADSKGMFD
jgi:hypothetical protein